MKTSWDSPTSAPASRTVLWVSAHPEPDSLNGRLRRDGIAALHRQGHTVVESDLYAMGWDPVIRPENLDRRGRVSPTRVSAAGRRAQLEDAQPDDVAAEQLKLRRADAVIVQFPLWWYGMPAILKGWFDRVFVSGFAFGTDPHTGRRLRFEQGPFRGARALTVITLGDRPASIGPRGKSGELHELLFGLLHGTFAYTGMEPLVPWALPSADFTDADSHARARCSLRDRLVRLFDEEPLRYREQFTGDYTDQWELQPEVLPGQTGLSVHLR
ncbi:NAD(P)H-dependent oxidoreductase [Nesterenkonia xinjiangensis]|uniref:NAD(P)H dehydrogenase (Quinone) n=1 Tax=Nesterenkonia xinjiangensis TaxID=225327 RepID=A0A7Z0GM49_9MICC|nr:NAD(P)H-dependent oxidoreductase [Nesterenkonia xinjiangensis]NYJ77701.1 NAD(P)H dehydrogenase (quinone) [Nesterenkonia xinjiangensis]